VGDARQSRQAGDPPERVPTCTPDDGERHPVVGHDRVTESDARRGGDQGGGGAVHLDLGRCDRPDRLVAANLAGVLDII
jgi:hypothetical protein